MRSELSDKRAAQAALVTLRSRHPADADLHDLIGRAIDLLAVAQEFEIRLQMQFDSLLRSGSHAAAFRLAANHGCAVACEGDGFYRLEHRV